MTTEQAFWSWLGPKLAKVPHSEFERVENKVGIGTPDLNYTVPGKHGWIELKSHEQANLTERSKVYLKHKFSPVQLDWLKTRGLLAPKTCWGLVKINQYIVLLDSMAVNYVDGTLLPILLQNIAKHYWLKDKFDAEEFVRLIS